MYRLKTPQEIIGADAPNFYKDGTTYTPTMKQIAEKRISGTLLGKHGKTLSVNFIFSSETALGLEVENYVCVNAPKDWFSEVSPPIVKINCKMSEVEQRIRSALEDALFSCQTCVHAYPHIEAASCQFDKCECIYHHHIVNCRLLNEYKKGAKRLA